MYCTDEEMKIRKTGRVTITKDGISVEGFDVDGAMCRVVAVMAAAWRTGFTEIREVVMTILRWWVSGAMGWKGTKASDRR